MSEEIEQEVQEKKPQRNQLGEMYKDYFLDYASYVILERAVPAVEDGFKPVQRRILHAMHSMDDGRFHKVANIIGQTMQYHPHGDAAIGDALVNLGQKDLLIDCQGNWGDVRTGDRLRPLVILRPVCLSLPKQWSLTPKPPITNWLMMGEKKSLFICPLSFLFCWPKA